MFVIVEYEKHIMLGSYEDRIQAQTVCNALNRKDKGKRKYYTPRYTIKDVYKVEENVKASLKIEDKEPSIKGQRITRRYLTGKLTSKEAIMEIRKVYKV